MLFERVQTLLRLVKVTGRSQDRGFDKIQPGMSLSLLHRQLSDGLEQPIILAPVQNDFSRVLQQERPDIVHVEQEPEPEPAPAEPGAKKREMKS